MDGVRRGKKWKSFAEAASEGNKLSIHNMKQIKRREKIEDKIDDERKLSNEDNIIIHGLVEEDTEETLFVSQ